MRGRPRACVRALVMAHQIDLFCMPQLADARCLEADQNGGTALTVLGLGPLPGSDPVPGSAGKRILEAARAFGHGMPGDGLRRS